MKIDKEILKKIYLTAFKIRKVEEEIADRYKEQEMRCPVHLSIGQELVPAVYSMFVTENDYAVSTHRAHAHYLSKGGSINKMIAEIYGKETGCSKGLGGSMHLIDEEVGFMGSTAIVGGTIPVGTGLGLSIKIKQENKISTVFLGDGSTEEGVFYESLNFAAVKDLPVLYICENNMYSVYSNLEVRQPKNRKIYKLAESIGIKSSHANGYDVEDCYMKLEEAINYVKENKKPFFIELDTYRYREHCGPNYDNHIGYREEQEYKKHLEKDPLNIMKEYLSDESLDIEEKKILEKIDDAFTFAKESQIPKYENIEKYIYKEKN
ncbi:thiamine pyrophosphate-dependent dehydrogenase E1 component subunit alpha [Sulfurimonas sp.]|nr:thiamine pyrophosphate-dependent dehydrogenase E1 component subunit alpha [Sulfurimonas sp.]